MTLQSLSTLATDYAEFWWYALAVVALLTMVLYRPARSSALRLWLQVPFGRICSVKLHNGAKAYLRKDLWVIVEDKNGCRDALPLNLTSSKLQESFLSRMRKLGYETH